MIPTWQKLANDLREYADSAAEEGYEEDARTLREAADELERLGRVEQRHFKRERELGQ